MSLINLMKSNYRNIFVESADPVLINYPFMSGPLPIAIIIVIYIYSIKVALPAFMKNRHAYNLDKVIHAYNIFQVVFNLIIGYIILTSGWFQFPNFYCGTMDFYKTVPSTPQVNFAMYAFFVSKIFELVETAFFVLRKKDKQASKFHIFHHVLAVIFTWMPTKYYPYAAASLPFMLNAFMHSIMYAYYQMAVVGHKWADKLKPWITVTQMIQLTIILTFCIYMIFNSCPAPKWVFAVEVVPVLIVLLLFVNFYLKTYNKARQNKLAKKSS